jgi:hypothetical protein
MSGAHTDRLRKTAAPDFRREVSDGSKEFPFKGKAFAV